MKLVTPGRALTMGLALLAVVVALFIVPSSEYIFLPDEAHLVGPLVSVAGEHPAKGPGGIYFVDVIVRKATLIERLFGGLHKGADLESPDNVLPAGVTNAQNDQLSLEEMKTSQQVAGAVALRSLGYKVKAVGNGARVDAIEPGLPAVGKLEPTDVIVAVDGKPVTSPATLSAAMHKQAIGSLVRFTVHREGKTKTVSINTVADPKSKRAIVGIFVEPAEAIHLPIRVSIDAGNVGGPSAGLAFALDVLEKLGHNVDRGNKIAATGEIFLNGDVGPIGGIKQKTFGAREAGVDAFLVPAGQNATDAKRYADGLRIIPVKSFQQALHALATLPEKRSVT
ncbi:MAG TPA: S16 family serine protease [Gaiellaceae bacterium]|nr:S16 family serine protease [Gaiellaceae bacterium]